LDSYFHHRTYREKHNQERFRFFNAKVHESDLHVGIDPSVYSFDVESTAQNEIMRIRKVLESCFSRFPEFLTSLKPLNHDMEDPFEIRDMKKAALKAGVGPMAGVAGLISELVGRKLLSKYFPKEIIVENGGDIWTKVKEPLFVEIFAGDSPLSGKLMLKIPPEKTPVGICTSSGTVGHSFSFGKADAVVISCQDASLADALATAVCNIVKTEDDIEKAGAYMSGFKEILSAVIIIGDKVYVSGSFDIMPAK
jgi:uncharacterized protein